MDAHFVVALRLFVRDAGTPTVDSREPDNSLPLSLGSLVGLLSSALVGLGASLPPSFSHPSSIFFFRRFLAIGSGIRSVLVLWVSLLDPGYVTVKNATGLSRGRSRLQLPGNSESLLRCHALAAWTLTFAFI